MGADSHTNYALRKNGQQPITPIHPELAEPLAEILGATYGLIVYQEQVMADRPAARRLHARQGRPAAPGDGQEEARGARRRVRRLLGRHEGQRLLRGGHQDAVGHPGPVLRLRVQQGAHRRLRAGVLLDGLPQGELPGRVHGRAAHQRARRQGQVRALPQRVPPDGHQGAAAGRQRVGRRTSPRGGTDIRFGLAAIRNVGDNVVDSIAATREAKGRFTDFYDFLQQGRPGRLQQEDRRVADQGRRVRLPRRPAPWPAQRARRGHRRVHGHQAQRGARPVRPVRRS